jgi:hypothetical protein
MGAQSTTGAVPQRDIDIPYAYQRYRSELAAMPFDRLSGCDRAPCATASEQNTRNVVAYRIPARFSAHGMYNHVILCIVMGNSV